MNILIVNDDGYLAQGINELKRELSSLGRVVMIAPNREYSATGHKIKLGKLLSIEKAGEDKYFVNSTPADCVRVALSGAIQEFPKFDLVVSGINHGPNLGIDVYCSGTLAAAREAIFHGIPSMGVSLCSFSSKDVEHHFSMAAIKTREIIEVLKEKNLLQNKELYLNINIPNIEEPKGFKITHCGKQYYNVKVEEFNTNNAQNYYLIIDFPLKNYNKESHDDFLAVSENYISVTPLKTDLTKKEDFEEIKKALNP